jgi:hypothetical protein
MHVLLSFEKKIAFEFGFTDTSRIMRGLLYHTGKDLPGHTSFQRDQFAVQEVMIDNVYITMVNTLDQLQAATQQAWCQQSEYIYLKLSDEFMGYNFTNSVGEPWVRKYKNLSMTFGLTDGEFIVFNDAPYKTGMLNGYKVSLSVDSMTEYNQIKFTTLTLQIIYKKISEAIDSVIGSLLRIYINGSNEIIDRQFIENYTCGIDTVKLTARDPRASLKEVVLDQKFISAEFVSPTYTTLNNVTEKDVLKKYKGDAIGYCSGVPGDCYNGYSYDKDPYRYYRFCYGQFTPDNQSPADGSAAVPAIEAEYDSGWRLLQPNKNSGDAYTFVNYTETLPNGTLVTTMLLRVNALLAHGVKEGTSTPDYDNAARRIRITGWFHTELGQTASTQPYTIIKYLFDRYSRQLFDATYFNMSEMQSELAPLNNYPIGIYFGKQIDLNKAISQVQGGGIMGFKFCVYQGQYTCRLHLPTRATKYVLKSGDIKNLYQLQPDMEGTDYVSDAHVHYGIMYSEDDLYSDYYDEDVRSSILNTRGSDKNGSVETLLKDESSAKLRFQNFTAFSRAYCPSIEGLEMNEKDVDKWRKLREYDIVEFDFSQWYPQLKQMTKWYITKMDFDMAKDSVKLSLRRNPNG